MRTIRVKPLGRDNFNRQLYKSVETGQRFCDIDDVKGYDEPPEFLGQLTTMSRDGEPDCPVRAIIEIVTDSPEMATVTRVIQEMRREMAVLYEAGAFNA